jgi:hypothetical protein
MALWKVLLGVAVVGGVVAVVAGGDDPDNKLPDDGTGKDGAEDEPGHLTPDKPPRPEPPSPDELDVSLGWGPNVIILEHASQFQSWAILDVVDRKPNMAAKRTVYFGYSRQWENFQAELDMLRKLAPRNDDVLFIVFDLADARAATGQPEDELMYVATAVGPEGQPREQDPLFAKNLAAKNIPAARWQNLIGFARNGPGVNEGHHASVSGPAPEAPPSAGNYGPNAQSRYLPDHPRGPHWVVTICEREQLPDGKVTRCRWYLFKGKHAGALSQADYSSTQYGKPWAGSLGSRAGAFAKAIDFIDDYNEAGAVWQ